MDSQTGGACQGLINRLKSVITSESFKARHRQQVQDFTRKRCLSAVPQNLLSAPVWLPVQGPE